MAIGRQAGFFDLEERHREWSARDLGLYCP